MEEIKIVDDYMDKREFRNYINTMFDKCGYQLVSIDDVRLSDMDKMNDNDFIVMKEHVNYTVQTYLNMKIGEKQIEETLKDMKNEGILHGIIVTNRYVDAAMKDRAMKKDITILDRSSFERGIYH